MTGEEPTSPATGVQEKFTWGHAGLEAEFATGSDGALRITRLTRPGAAALPPVGAESAPPLVEITALGY
ncbi:hypothetical protein ABT314_14220, partial [Streptomyces spiralis]